MTQNETFSALVVDREAVRLVTDIPDAALDRTDNNNSFYREPLFYG